MCDATKPCSSPCADCECSQPPGAGTTPIHAPITGGLPTFPEHVHVVLQDAERILGMPGTTPKGVLGHYIREWRYIKTEEGKTGTKSHLFVATCDECGAAATVQCACDYRYAAFTGDAFNYYCTWSE